MKKYILVMLVLGLLVIVGCASEVDQHVEVVEEEQSDIEVVEEFFLDYQDCVDFIEVPESYQEGELIITTEDDLTWLEFETLHGRVNGHFHWTDEFSASLDVTSVEPVYSVSVTPGYEREFMCMYLEGGAISAEFVL